MSNKIILYSVPRSGSHATMNAFREIGLKVPDEYQPFSEKIILDHVGMAENIFEKYDVFNIEGKQTLQLQEILEKTGADLICLRRKDIYATIASFWGFVSGHCTDTNSYDTWTAKGKNATYDPQVIERIFEFNSFIGSVAYCNYLIDNVFPKYKSYITTVNYESPKSGVLEVERYLNKSIDLDFGPKSYLSDYFINHDEFRQDIEKRLYSISEGGLLLKSIKNSS